MATETSENGSEECIDKKCSVCIQKGSILEASKFCVECADYYCMPCSNIHMCFPSLKGHTLLDEWQYRGHDYLPLSNLPVERCTSHKANNLEMFCEDHDEVVCATCVIINHRSCKKLHSIPDEIGSLYDQTGSDQVTQQLSEDREDFKDEINATKQVLSELKEQKKVAIESINDYKADLVAEINKLEEESLKQVDEHYDITEGHLQNAIKEAEGNINDMEHSLDKLKNSNENKVQHFVCAKTARKNISKAKMSKELLKELADIKMQTFISDLKIKKYIQQTKSLGQLCTRKEPTVLRTSLYTVIKQRNVGVKIPTDRKACRIFGTCFTDDGCLLLADYNNVNLKRLNVSTDTIKDHLTLEAPPNAVCQTSKDEAAVSLSNKSIQYVSLGEKMTATRVLKMDHYCSGLACQDRQLFISDGSSAICMFDGYNTFIQKRLTEKSGDSLLKRTRHLCVSTNTGIIYVADTEKGLIALDKQGSYLSTFSDSDLVETRGVCTDGKGSIFVCGHQSACILQITDGTTTKLGTIESGLHQLSVCFDPRKNNLFVTYDGINTVQVYDLQ